MNESVFMKVAIVYLFLLHLLLVLAWDQLYQL